MLLQEKVIEGFTGRLLIHSFAPLMATVVSCLRVNGRKFLDDNLAKQLKIF